MTVAVPGPRPKESLFYAPVVYLLGKLSGFKAYVGVNHKLVQDDALRLVGFDILEEEDEDGESFPVAATDGVSEWPLKDTSSKNRDGLYRIVSFGWYHQTRQYRLESKAMCARPIDAATKGKRGYWALTDLGVKRAKALRDTYEGQIVLSAGPNATAQFLGDNWDRFYDRGTLALRRKLPRSEALNKVEDHFMNWAEKIIQRDGLRGRIEAKKPIAPSHVAGWARKAAYTQLRNEGRKPICRVFHGALTPKEVKAIEKIDWCEEVIPRTINESETLCHNQYAAHNESDWISDPIEALQDTHPTSLVHEALADSDAFEQCLNQVSGLLLSEISKDHDPEFHRQVMHDRFVKEMTVREIAESQGLNFTTNEGRIKVAITRVREVMLQARDKGNFDDFLVR